MNRVLEIALSREFGITRAYSKKFTQLDTNTHYISVEFPSELDLTDKSMQVNFIKANNQVVMELVEELEQVTKVKLSNSILDTVGQVKVEIVIRDSNQEQILTINRLASFEVLETVAGKGIEPILGENTKEELEKVIEDLEKAINDSKQAIIDINNKISKGKEDLEKVVTDGDKSLKDVIKKGEEDIGTAKSSGVKAVEDKAKAKIEEIETTEGMRGPIGPEGPRGFTGETGRAFVYEDFTPAQLENLTGPVGPKGEQGEIGPMPSISHLLEKGNLPAQITNSNDILSLIEANTGIEYDYDKLYIQNEGLAKVGKSYFDLNQKGIFKFTGTVDRDITINDAEYFKDISQDENATKLENLSEKGALYTYDLIATYGRYYRIGELFVGMIYVNVASNAGTPEAVALLPYRLDIYTTAITISRVDTINIEVDAKAKMLSPTQVSLETTVPTGGFALTVVGKIMK